MRRSTIPAADFQPLWQMNTTPLIDVLLVLLIMFILTIPVQTHKVAIDLPSSRAGIAMPGETHRLRIAENGTLSWDGSPIAGSDLTGRLRAVALHPEATLQLEVAAEARYARFDQVLAEAKRAGIRRRGFVGNEKLRI